MTTNQAHRLHSSLRPKLAGLLVLTSLFVALTWANPSIAIEPRYSANVTGLAGNVSGGVHVGERVDFMGSFNVAAVSDDPRWAQTVYRMHMKAFLTPGSALPTIDLDSGSQLTGGAGSSKDWAGAWNYTYATPIDPSWFVPHLEFVITESFRDDFGNQLFTIVDSVFLELPVTIRSLGAIPPVNSVVPEPPTALLAGLGILGLLGCRKQRAIRRKH